jgi:hypothetical protein
LSIWFIESKKIEEVAELQKYASSNEERIDFLILYQLGNVFCFVCSYNIAIKVKLSNPVGK